MSDRLGAAPYTPERTSWWTRLVAWWRGPTPPLRGAGGGLTARCPFGPNARPVAPAPPPLCGRCGVRHQGACDGGTILVPPSQAIRSVLR